MRHVEKVSRGGWGSTETLCFSVGSGQAPRTLAFWVLGSWQSRSLASPCFPRCSPRLLAEFLKLHRRQRHCCRRGIQLLLLGLVVTVLCAGLLALILLWREDTLSPTGPPSRVPSQTPTLRSWGAQHTPQSPISPSCLPPCPHQPLPMPLPPSLEGTLPCPRTPVSPPFGTSHTIYPRSPSPAGRWGVDGWST